MQDTVQDTVFVTHIWTDSRGYNKFWRSYFFMITHPKKCLKLVNFAIKILASYNINIEKE